MLDSNLFEGIPEDLPEERFDTILEKNGLRLERIVSRGHATAEGEWYDQAEDEWVALLQGGAAIIIEGRNDPVVMAPGDHLHLPTHCRHRVAWTDPDVDTVWLALHLRVE